MICSYFKDTPVRQYYAAFIGSLSIVVLGTMTAWPAPAIARLTSKDSQVPMTDDELSWMVSMLNLGNMISPIPSGYLMDLIGRKVTLLHFGALPICSWYFLLTATRPYHLYIGRFLGGLSFGVVHSVLPIYVAEICDSHTRGTAINCISIMSSFGALIDYTSGSYLEYKSLIYVCLFVPVLFMLTFYWIPESPYYLVMVGNRKQAKESLSWLRYDWADDDVDLELSTMEAMTKKQMKKNSKFSELIRSKGNRKALIIVQVLGITQRFTGTGTLMSYTSITIPKHPIKGMSFGACMTLLGLVWFFGSIVSPFMTERSGRKIALLISLTGCGVSTFAAACWFFLNEKTNVDVESFKWIPYLSFLIHALFYSVGIGPIALSIKAELFPANIKGKASAISSFTLASSSFILNRYYLPIADHFGMYLNFAIFTITCTIVVFFVAFYVIETHSRTLDDIQRELHRFSVMSADSEDGYLLPLEQANQN